MKNYKLLVYIVNLVSFTLYGQVTTKVADNLEPFIFHQGQERQAQQKLQELEQKYGKKPNILIFVVDDLGYADPGIYGGGSAIGAPTPNIDKLAKEGLKLTSTYSQPTCSPTRATIMTGRLPIRHGIYRPPMYSEPGGLEDEVTAAQILQNSGYTTALVGKWHLGENERQQPQNVGYDEFYGFLGVSNIYTDWRDERLNPEVVLNKKLSAFIENSNFNKNLVTARKGEKLRAVKEITIPVVASIDQDFARYTNNFIRRMSTSEKPFYLIHNFSRVHFDNYSSPQFRGKSPAKDPYHDAVVEVDALMGDMINTLKETGQAENTLVFFTSDNGAEEDTWPDTGYTPFRGSKGSTWEGGVRVPGIAWWPGVIKPGRESDGLFDLADLFNTALSVAGVKNKLPKDRYIDGVDQTSFLLADRGESNRFSVFFWLDDKFSGIRIGNFKVLKYFVRIGNDAYTDMGALSNGVLEQSNAVHLFNLYTDPKERRPMAIRKLWALPAFRNEMTRYINTFKKYPKKPAQVSMSGISDD